MILEVNNLYKAIKDNQILNNVSFSINKNQIISIIGHSGAGKTTLLKCLNGLTNYDSGNILIDNKAISDYNKNSLHEKISIVFQNYNLFPHLNVIDNISISLTLKEKNNINKIYDKARTWLNFLQLENKEKLYPYQLSGGEKQRVAIARACMLNPKIICFDEPTSALDPYLVNEVAKIIKTLKKENKTVLIITHDLSFAKSVSDRIITIEKGTINNDIEIKNDCL